MNYIVKQLEIVTPIDKKIDLSDYITRVNDLLEILPVHVVGQLIKTDFQVNLVVKVSTSLVMPCAITLKPVQIPISFTLESEFSNFETSDYPLEDKIELKEILFGNLLAERPFKVYHPDADLNQFEEKPGNNQAFAELATMLEEIKKEE